LPTMTFIESTTRPSSIMYSMAEAASMRIDRGAATGVNDAEAAFDVEFIASAAAGAAGTRARVSAAQSARLARIFTLKLFRKAVWPFNALAHAGFKFSLD